MPTARDSEAVAFDIESMKPTPCGTSDRRIGHGPFAVSISCRVFAAACSSVARCDSLRYSFHSALAGDVLQADDAVLDPRRAEDLDQRDVARPRDVGAAAGFDVPLRDLDDAQLAPGDGAA